MIRLINKSIFVLKNYGLKVFLIKVIRWPINRLNPFRQKREEQKAKKNTDLVIQQLKKINSTDPEEIFNFS